MRRLKDPQMRDPFDEPLSYRERKAAARWHSQSCDCEFCSARQAEADAEYELRKERELYDGR